MNEKYATLYNEMLKDLERMMEQDLPETERVSNCFWVAAHYWDELKKRIDSSILEHQETAIDFFRNVKPKFTGYIQYYTIVLEALLFVPENSANEISFWEEELKRYHLFSHKHRDFVEYFQSTRTDMDAIWFTRAPDDSPDMNPVMTYDRDKNFCSTHDALVRGLFAHELYHAFAGKKREAMRIYY